MLSACLTRRFTLRDYFSVTYGPPDRVGCSPPLINPGEERVNQELSVTTLC